MKNSRSLRKSAAARATALVAAVALIGGACGSSGGSSSAELIDWFEDQGETTASAECFAKELSNYSLSDLDSFDGAESQDDISTGMLEVVSDASEICADL